MANDRLPYPVLQSAAPRRASPPPPPALSPLVAAIKNGPQFTLLGDTDHSDKKLRSFFDGTELLSSLKEAGVKHLFLENASEKGNGAGNMLAKLPLEELNSFKDDLRKSGLAGQGRAIIEKVVDFFIFAKKSGINIHFPDHPGSIDPNIKNDPVYRCYQDSSYKRMLTYDTTLASSLLRERLAQDQPVADRIKNIARNEKSVVLWGIGHGFTKNGLDEGLGRKQGRAQVILAMTNASQANIPSYMNEMAKEFGLGLENANQLYYNIETKKLTRSFPELEKVIKGTKQFEGKWPGVFCKPPA